MRRKELVDHMAASQSMTKQEAGRYLTELFDTITEEIAAGNRVQIYNFGTFKTKHHAARTIQTPNTRESIDIPAREVPVFIPSARVKTKVRNA